MDKTNDLTTGKVSKVLLAFFFPLLITNLLQRLYILADTAIVGKGLGDDALAAVGNMSSLTFLVIGFAQGITGGFSVIVAQRFGEKNLDKLRKSVAVSVKLSVWLSVILTSVSVLFLKKILLIMNTDINILKDSLIYGYIIFGGIIVTMAYNLCCGILRAFGDSKTPFVAIMVASVVNIVLDCIFIFPLDLGVGGAAIATVIAQFVSVAICVKHLRKSEFLQLVSSDFKWDFSLSRTLMKNGIPMACMNSITAAGCMVVQAYVNDMGVVYTSAYSVCYKYVDLFMLPAVTVGAAMSAFAGQNYGAKKYDRIRSGVGVCLMIGVISYILFGTVMVHFPKPLAQLLLSGEQAIDLVCEYLKVSGSMFFLINFLFVYRSAVQGMGKPFIPMCSGVLEMVARIVVIVVLVSRLGFVTIAYGDIFAWLGALLLNYIEYIVFMRKRFKEDIA